MKLKELLALDGPYLFWIIFVVFYIFITLTTSGILGCTIPDNDRIYKLAHELTTEYGPEPAPGDVGWDTFTEPSNPKN
jgi:hypothetical protein